MIWKLRQERFFRITGSQLRIVDYELRNFNSHYLIKKEYILSKQLLRSGTSIGANIEEAR